MGCRPITYWTAWFSLSDDRGGSDGVSADWCPAAETGDTQPGCVSLEFEPIRSEDAVRARRSCLSVPGSSPKFLAKAAGLPADEVFFDLEDSVAPLEKEGARDNIIEALKNNTFQAPTKIVRINGVYTKWAYRDIITIAEAVGDLIDGFMIPKVETANDVTFVADLLRMIEETTGLQKRLGIEVQIETALGLMNLGEIARASDRTED